jgi:hypothetical protein
MSWLTWLSNFIKRFLGERVTNATVIAYSPNKRAELSYEVKTYPGAVALFYLKNETDSIGQLELSFDELSELYKEFRRQKRKRPITVKDSPLEEELTISHNLELNYRLTVTRSWDIPVAKKETRTMRNQEYVIDFFWIIQDQSDSPNKSFINFAKSLLKKELPEHHSDWCKYLCDPYAIDWSYQLEIMAKAQNIRVVFPKQKKL